LVARRRPGDENAVVAQELEVALRRGVLPHLHVHRRRKHQRAAPREAKRRQEIIGEPMRHLGHEVGARRRHQDQVAVARMLDVTHVVGHSAVPKVGPDRLPGQRLHGDRRDEPDCRFGHRHAHVNSAAREQAHELGSLVGRDAAGNAQKNPFTRQLVTPGARLGGNDSKGKPRTWRFRTGGPRSGRASACSPLAHER
jgi:hypothetical protein